MPIITTAKDGQTLRDYATLIKHDDSVIIFPETGLSATEQAAFLSTIGDKYSEVVTFSSFIISDAEEDKLKIIDDESYQCPINHGDSVNKVTMALWRRQTIGDLALAKLNIARNQLNTADTKKAIQDIIDTAYDQLGDSVEKTLFINTALNKMDALSQLPALERAGL